MANESQSRLRSNLEYHRAFRGAAPNRSRNFCSEYILWCQQWTATAAKQRPNGGHCYCSTQQLQQRQVSKRLPTADHPRTLHVTTSESERVFCKLQRTLTSIRSTMTEDRLQALLLLQCHREHCPMPDDFVL